jgi:hypothetical protein
MEPNAMTIVRPDEDSRKLYSEASYSDVKRLCAADGSDTLIFIVTQGTPLCAQLLGLLRSPERFEPNAAARFESGWARYVREYARSGGMFGALLCPEMKKFGPIMAMGDTPQLANLIKALSLRARELTRGTLTPIFFERAFHGTVHAVTAELLVSEPGA